MRVLDKLVERIRASRGVPAARVSPSGEAIVVLVDDHDDEARLRAALHADPNDTSAFPQLAEIVRRRAGEGHEAGDQQRAADDAVWALAEELAHNGRAWFPLVELARLSVHDDREAALRRLATAAERDPSGQALATGLAMLREARLPSDALGLGVGHWRPREHDIEAGRHIVLAAIESGRWADARRHLDALGLHPDQGSVVPLKAELERLIARSEQTHPDPTRTPARGSVIDLRDQESRSSGARRPFRRR